MRASLILYVFFFSLSCISGQVVHKVENGETLYRVARQFGISVKSLMDANDITDPTSVRVGTVLKIPGKNSTASSTYRSSSASRTHRVAPGDTYYSIARRYNMSVNQLLNINNRTSNTILKVGEILALSENASSASNSIAVGGNITPATVRIRNTENLPMVNNTTWPVSGRMMKHEGKQGGVKIQLSSPQDVRAVASGTVVYHGRYRELGPIVLVEHEGGYIYIYAGVSSSMLKVGDRIGVGDVLGRSSPGRDVVFSVFKDANPIDPKEAPRV